MYITLIHVGIAALLIIMLMVVSFYFGADRSSKRVNQALEYASSAGQQIKVQNRFYKLISASELSALRERAERVAPVQWSR